LVNATFETAGVQSDDCRLPDLHLASSSEDRVLRLYYDADLCASQLTTLRSAAQSLGYKEPIESLRVSFVSEANKIIQGLADFFRNAGHQDSGVYTELADPPAGLEPMLVPQRVSLILGS